MTMDRVAVTRPSSVQDIFILRPDNLGDVVLFSGALRAVRGHFPNAKITLCTRRYTHNLLELCPHIDRLVAWEARHATYVTGGDTHIMTPLPRTVYGPPDWEEASLDDWLGANAEQPSD